MTYDSLEDELQQRLDYLSVLEARYSRESKALDSTKQKLYRTQKRIKELKQCTNPSNVDYATPKRVGL